jgi:hypothetical protein
MSSTGEPQTIDMGASMETEEGLAIIDALNEVSDVLAMEGARVTFVGERKASLAPAGRLAGADVYQCPRGWFVLCREAAGPHWAVAGPGLGEALAAIHEDAVREAVRGGAQARGLL